MTALDELTNSLLKRRHAIDLEAAFVHLIRAWRSHFERVPTEVEERRSIIWALAHLSEGKTPRDQARIGSLPSALLEPKQQEAISLEIEAVFGELPQSVGEPAQAVPAAAPAPPSSSQGGGRE